MIEVFTFAVLFSKLKGLKIKPLFRHWSIYPVLFMTLLYVVLQYMILNHNYMFLPYQYVYKSTLILSYLILGLDILVRNEVYKPFLRACKCLISGYLLNYIVMAFNGGKMPIYPSWSLETGYFTQEMVNNIQQFSKIHVLGSYNTKFVFLADVYDCGWFIASIGDIAIRIFAFMILYYSIKQVNKNKNISIDK